MKRKTEDKFGLFNILVVGDNSYSSSIADNIRTKFSDCDFNIVEENVVVDENWFNEFIYGLATSDKRNNNIYISRKFNIGNIGIYKKHYLKKLLQSMNFIVIDINDTIDGADFHDDSIPYFKFNPDKDFADDMFSWISDRILDVNKVKSKISLTRALSGGSKSIPYLGDVYGCFSKKANARKTIKAEEFRFDAPILYDEFCFLVKNIPISELDDYSIVRSNSALSVFFK